MDHDKEFDGIKQADNALPNWWKNIFLGSIFISIGYGIYFHTYSNWGTKEQYETQANEHEKLFPHKEIVANADGSNPLREDKDAIQSGKKNFMAACVACHGPEGKGLVGPNLMDAEWIHGSTDSELYLVISNGIIAEKTKLNRGIMPAHSQLGSEKIYQILAWMASENPNLKSSKK